MSHDPAVMGCILSGLCRFFPADEWALRGQVRSATGCKEGTRIADAIAVRRWGDAWVADLVEIKQSAYDLRNNEPPERSKPGRAICRRWWIVVPPPLVKSVRHLVPEGWGLLSCGEGDPRIVDPAPVHGAVPPGPDMVRGLVCASPIAVELVQVPPRSKILPRRVPKVERAHVSKLTVALDAIREADAEQIAEIEEALRARRAA